MTIPLFIVGGIAFTLGGMEVMEACKRRHSYDGGARLLTAAGALMMIVAVVVRAL